MLFYFYLISIAFSIIVTCLIDNFYLKMLVRDHIYIQGNSGFFLLLLFFKIIFPVYNVFYAIYLIFFHRRIYEKMITKLFMNGKANFD